MPRPRNQPESDSLEQALRLFWDHGYDRTSIGELSKALGVGPSSIYNAFGSKSELFRRSLTHYAETHLAFVKDIVDQSAQRGLEPSLRELVRQLVDLYSDTKTPLGCAIFQGGGGGCSNGAEGVEIAEEFREKVYETLVNLLKSKQPTDHLSSKPSRLAKYLLAVLSGLSQLACDGTSRRELHAIANLACNACFTQATK